MSDLEKIKIDVKEIDSRANTCWYDIKILARAVLLMLEELTADRKTENSSEIPNNCEDLQDWKDRMWAEAIVTEPQPTTDCRQTDCYMCKWLGEVDVCGRCRNRNLFCEAEPQAERGGE